MLHWVAFSVLILMVTQHNLGHDVVEHPAWSILNDVDCGESAIDRIIGGKKASLGQFPWIVQLGYENNNAGDGIESIEWMCGGSLVSPQHVITAAHCVSDLEPGLKLKLVRLGEYDTRYDPDCQAGQCAPPVQDRGLTRIIPHESFNEPPFHNDIAILKLDRPVQLSGYVNTVCLPKDEPQGHMQTKEVVITAGWGKMNMTTAAYASALQFVQLPVVDGKACYEMMRTSEVTNSVICAGAEVNHDACTGDSGGPLMKVYDTDDGPKSFLVGVVSFGPSVCGIKVPGVYTSTLFFRKWILDHLV